MKTQVDLIIKHASELITVANTSGRPKSGQSLQDLGIIYDGAVAVHGGHIAAIGTTAQICDSYEPGQVVDAGSRVVTPGLVDPHTHLIFGKLQKSAYEAKVMGESYANVHRAGAGIHHTVECTRGASKQDLIQKALKDLDICLTHGTTTIEIKSGYGLDPATEIKILEVIEELKKRHPLNIVATFLGAHTVPLEFQNDRAGYVRQVISLLPQVAKRKLAEFCDVFCDDLGFSYSESREILQSAKQCGLKIKIHAEQTGYLGGSELAAELGAVSADHLDYIGEPQKEESGYVFKKEHAQALARSGVIGVLLPGVTFHSMDMTPGGVGAVKDFLPATVRLLIEENVPLALSTDYNPGSSWTQSLKTVMEIAARMYRMNYTQIINAVTINAAYAIDRGNTCGSLEPGKRADLVIFDCAKHGDLIESFGINLVDNVFILGEQKIQHGCLLNR